MSKIYKNCQSCEIPLKKDPQGGSHNADGTKNTMFCSYCFENGQFKQPDFTVDQMKQLSKEKMVEMGFPKFLAGFFSKSIRKLERWK